MLKKIKKSNSFLGVCPICRNNLNKDKSDIINKNKFTTLFCVECSKCCSSVMLAVFSATEEMTTTMGILTDIQNKDKYLVRDNSFLTVDDVLDFYKCINK